MERRQVLFWFSALGATRLLSGAAKAAPEPPGTPYHPSCLHPNGRWVALPGPKGDPIELWDIHTGERVERLPISKAPEGGYPNGLGAAMSTRDGQYRKFHGLLFHGREALVGAWTGYDTSYAWVVGLPGAPLANRHFRVEQGKAEDWPKAVPTSAWDCIASLYPSGETFSRGRWSMQAASDATVWTITRKGAEQQLAELRISNSSEGNWSATPYAVFSGSCQCTALTVRGCSYDQFSFKAYPKLPIAKVVLWPWRDKAKRVSTLDLKRGDIDRIHPIDEVRWVVALHQHTFSTRSQIPLGETRLIELPSLKEFVPAITETHSCQMGVDLQQGILVAQYGAGSVRCYDLETRRLTRLLTAFMPHQGLLAWGPDNRHLLTARPLGQACLWDRQGRSTKVEGVSDPLIRPPVVELGMETRCLLWLPERDLLIQGREDGSLRAFQRKGLRPVPVSNNLQFETEPQKPLWRLAGAGGALRGLALSPGQEGLLGLEQEGRLLLWSLTDRRVLAQVQAHPLRANAMVVDRQSQRVFTGGHDGVRSWSLTDLKPGLVIDTQGHWVSALALSGDRLIVGCLDGVIRCFDASSGQLRWKIEAHGGWVGGLDFSPTGVLASGGEDCCIALWDAEKGGQIKRNHSGGNLPRWSPDGGCLAVYAHDRVKVFTPELAFEDRERHHLKLDWGDDYT